MDGLDQVAFEPVRCIGCGLCLSVYPSSAVQLVRKPESEQPKIPKDTTRIYINIVPGCGESPKPGQYDVFTPIQANIIEGKFGEMTSIA